MFGGYSIGAVPLAGSHLRELAEIIGQIATRATVVRMNPTTTQLAGVSNTALLTNQSNVTIMKTIKR